MKRKLIVIGLALVVVAAAFALAFRLPSGKTALSPAAQAKTVSASEEYTIKMENGKINVYAKGSSKPMQTLEVELSNLPSDERQRLQKGIQISSRKELLAYIENYVS